MGEQAPPPPPPPTNSPNAPTSDGAARRVQAFVRKRWRGITIALVAFFFGWAVGASSNEKTTSASPSPPPPPAELQPPPPAEPPPPTLVPNPDASYKGQCDYVLGDFSEGTSGYRFLATADIENTGNIGVVARVTVTWNQLGGAPVMMQKKVKVWPGSSRSVPFNRQASSDEIDRHQSANSKCDVNAKVVDTFGEPVEG